jgi:hypothetical protein
MRKIVYKADIKKTKKTLKTIRKACVIWQIDILTWAQNRKFEPEKHFGSYPKLAAEVQSIWMAIYLASEEVLVDIMTKYLFHEYHNTHEEVNRLSQIGAMQLPIKDIADIQAVIEQRMRSIFFTGKDEIGSVNQQAV